MNKMASKIYLLVAVMLVLTSSVYAAKNPKKNTSKASRPEVWTLDIADAFCDSNGQSEFWKAENSGDSGYAFNLDFKSNAAFSLPKKGEVIRVTGKITSSIDLPYLNAYFVDDSKGWTDVTYSQKLGSDIKAGIPFDVDAEFTVQKESHGNLFLRCEYDLCWGEYADIPKVGKAAQFTFERVGESTDSYAFNTTSAEKWVLDITDADTDVRLARKDTQGQLYTLDRKFDVLFLGVYPKKGDFIEMNIKGVSDTDIPHLNIQLTDTSEAAKWWQEISTTYYPCIKNIKAGIPFSAKLLFPIDNPPKGNVTLRFHYDGEWEKEWRKSPDVGKAVKFTFERTAKSFDLNEQCKKIGVKNLPKVYQLDLSDSDLGTDVRMEWNDADWAKSYRNMISFRNLIKGDIPEKGDYIVFSYNMTASVDIPQLVLQVVDSSRKNTWNSVYNPDYFTLMDLKAGEAVQGKLFVKVSENPLYDVCIQFIYDGDWQLETYPAVGKASNLTFKKLVESTDTVKRRAPKTYKLDISKLLNTLKFFTVDKNFSGTTNQSEIAYYLTTCDITKLFKKGDLPLKGDTVELTFNGIFPEDFSGIYFCLLEENDYIWGSRVLAINSASDGRPEVTEMKIQSGSKFTYKEKLSVDYDADLAVLVGIGCVK
ncbi:MAG: hypothetical protein IJ688_04420 [Treponema sp.]|nr:hypothetical protein [Treponema sp.]